MTEREHIQRLSECLRSATAEARAVAHLRKDLRWLALGDMLADLTVKAQKVAASRPNSTLVLPAGHA